MKTIDYEQFQQIWRRTWLQFIVTHPELQTRGEVSRLIEEIVAVDEKHFPEGVRDLFRAEEESRLRGLVEHIRRRN